MGASFVTAAQVGSGPNSSLAGAQSLRGHGATGVERAGARQELPDDMWGRHIFAQMKGSYYELAGHDYPYNLGSVHELGVLVQLP